MSLEIERLHQKRPNKILQSINLIFLKMWSKFLFLICSLFSDKMSIFVSKLINFLCIMFQSFR